MTTLFLSIALATTAMADTGAPAAEGDPIEQRIEELELRIGSLEAAAVGPIQPAPPRRAVVRDSTLDSANDEAEGKGEGWTIASGTVVEDAVWMHGPIHVYGTVTGDAVGIGGDVLVHDGGKVGGDAVSIGGRVDVEPGGSVGGDRVGMADGGIVPAGNLTEAVDSLVSRAARRLASLLSLAAAGVLVLAFWPRHIARIAQTARDRPIWHGMAGLILVAVLSTGTVVLALTVLGIPIALGLVLLLGVAWLMGFVAVCLAVGQRLPGDAERRAPWVTFLAGAALVGLVSLLPVVGPVFLALVGFEAVGSALVSRLGNRGDPDGW